MVILLYLNWNYIQKCITFSFNNNIIYIYKNKGINEYIF